VTNDKTLLARAGLRDVDRFLTALATEPVVLAEAVERSLEFCSRALAEATA
jgi:hypothetical protein